MTQDHFDVLIVGAGLSGIGAAIHLQNDAPDRSFAILEGRDAIGGTWDLFRYPGIRSDSDMYTLGYKFKPWTAAKAIADGPSIRSYIHEAAAEHDIERHIRFGHQVRAAAWSSETASWTVTAEKSDGTSTEITCNFLYMCSGYYSYAEGHTPDFAGQADFAGQVIHPQFWPENLDLTGKQVVIIGSGATAVTLVPVLAKTAAHVTMLQRSPTYVVSRPGHDAIADKLRNILPAKLAYSLIRFKNVSLGMLFYHLTRTRPAKIKAQIIDGVRAELGPDYDVEKHFTPSYNPWDQRLCLVPDADLFASIKSGSASVETDVIDRFDASGIQLKSGKHLPADVIITATGLKLIALGGMKVSVDGTPVNPGDCLSYKGMMFSNIPNLAVSFGYINASWTLRSDLIAYYVGRILNHMKSTGTVIATPVPGPDVVSERLSMDLSSGYVQRGADALPNSGNRAPWKVTANYALDTMELRFGKVDDGELKFTRAAPAIAAQAPLLAEAAE
ncbi:cyclohexanone monooxygenase [Polymorphobacter glacialis]|uniref:Cyclohexanone monooxygenase n=1 Tax=Sandarakinorhabdus glacialis TaxID=1614636 RepID=A0A916ZLU5_9SPHN|nr:NAD(P)/FAD-dependent oxidoreductase [Polymorphobacter glacialis]GGE03980.1 cyclohexanone monooxygenase [Polymorphobacter glacialis]